MLLFNFKSVYCSYCFITSVNCWYIYPTKISLIVHKSSIMQPIDTARATKIKYLFPYLVAFSLFGQNHNQRIAPTLTNKSHPFRHTQIGRLIFKSNYKTLHSVSECSPINFRVTCRPIAQKQLRNFIFWQEKR